MKNPCKNCEDRHHNCHSQCEEYQEFADERNRINERRYLHNNLTYNNEQTKHKMKNYYKGLKK